MTGEWSISSSWRPTGRLRRAAYRARAFGGPVDVQGGAGPGRCGLFDLYAESAQTGRPLSLDGYHYRSQRLGFTAYFDVRAAPAPGDRLSLTWRDVTVAREVERRIAASEEHYRLLAQNSSEVVFRSREG